MAPRRGGGGGDGGSGSGGSTCTFCDSPLYLDGSGWKEPWILATIVVYCIALLTAFICVFGAAYYKRWRQASGRSGKYSAWTYFGAMGLAVLWYTLAITDVALHEEESTTTQSYYVASVFRLTSNLFSIILALILVGQFVESALHSRSRALAKWVKLVAILLTLLALVQIGFYIGAVATHLNGRSFIRLPDLILNLTFDATSLVALIGILVVFLKNYRSILQTKGYRAAALAALLAFMLLTMFSVAWDVTDWLDRFTSYTIYIATFDRAARIVQNLLYVFILALCFRLALLGSRGLASISPDSYVHAKGSA